MEFHFSNNLHFHGGQDHMVYIYPNNHQLVNPGMCDFYENNCPCHHRQFKQQQGNGVQNWLCLGHELHFHGGNDHMVYIYPNNHQLVNPGMCDFYANNCPCNNKALKQQQGNGVQNWLCLGHPTQHFHGGNDHMIYIYPHHMQLVNPGFCDFHHGQCPCNNKVFIKKDGNGVEHFRCEGH